MLHWLYQTSLINETYNFELDVQLMINQRKNKLQTKKKNKILTRVPFISIRLQVNRTTCSLSLISYQITRV